MRAVARIAIGAIIFTAGIAWERMKHNCYTKLGMSTAYFVRGDQEVTLEYIRKGDVWWLPETVCGPEFTGRRR